MFSAGSAQARSILATPLAIPGLGVVNVGPVYLYDSTGTCVNITPLTPIPDTLTYDPGAVEFGPTGDLFVSSGAAGAIYRFAVSGKGGFTSKATITAGVQPTVTGLHFSPWGELFTADYRSRTVSRFTFDASGNAVHNGSFIATDNQAQDIVFTPWGELLVADSYNPPVVHRWTFDADKVPVYKGSFTVEDAVPGYGQLHGMVFRSPTELLIANPTINAIHRFSFYDTTSAVPPVFTGRIDVPGGPVDLCMDTVGRLYVSGHFSGDITRITFDASGAATIDRSWHVDTNLGGIDFRP